MKIFFILSLLITSVVYGQNWHRTLPSKFYLAKDFKYVPGYKKNLTRLVDQNGYTERKVTLYSNNHSSEGKQIHVDFYLRQTKKEGKNPLVIFLPPILGITPADTWLGRRTAKRGINSIVLDFGDNLVDNKNEPKDINLGMYRGIIRFQMILEFIEKEMNTYLQADKIGIYGMSMGAVAGGVIMGLFHEKIASAFLVAGGGNMFDIITESKQGLVKKLREGLWKRHERRINKKMDSNIFRSYLKKSLKYDPITFASFLPREKMFLVMVKEDEGVPYKNQVDMWNGFGKPARMLFLKGGHAKSVIRTLLWPSEIMRFFKNTLIESERARSFKHKFLDYNNVTP